MGKKDKHTDEASAAPSSRLTPMEIQQKEFRVSRFGGYKMRDVDEFLDQITDTFSEMSAEIERLRAGGAALIIVEQDIGQALKVASRVYCLMEGRITLSGQAATTSREAIRDAYFGAAA